MLLRDGVLLVPDGKHAWLHGWKEPDSKEPDHVLDRTRER
jgi:hypothetical protein